MNQVYAVCNVHSAIFHLTKLSSVCTDSHPQIGAWTTSLSANQTGRVGVLYKNATLFAKILDPMVIFAVIILVF